MSGRSRELGVALALAVVSGAGLLVATGGTWATAVRARPAPLPAERVLLTAGDLAPGARALGLVVLAGSAALLAARGRARIVVGLLVLLGALGAGLLAARAAVDPGAVAPRGTPPDLRLTARPVLATLAALPGVLAGALVVVRGRRWAALGRRYDAPTNTPQPVDADPGDAAQAWEALDRGEDPTQDRAQSGS